MTLSSLIPLLIGKYMIVDIKQSTTKWSQAVTKKSNALDLEEGVFSWNDPKEIAKSLKRSADKSLRRKSSPFRSAMAMLVFYINRAGNSLNKEQKEILEQAKDELRSLYHRE